MKNLYFKIIKKAKEFTSSLTPASKIKYIIVFALTVILAASLIVVVSLNTNTPETPDIPDNNNETEKSEATIDFDTEMVFDIGENTPSESMDDDTSADSEGSSAETAEPEEIVSTETVSNTDAEESTEYYTDAAPDTADTYIDNDNYEYYNNEDYYGETYNNYVDNNEYENYENNEPVVVAPVVPSYEEKPAETTAAKETTAKPAETTTKAPETEPKPVETTTKAVETEPKPVETTTNEQASSPVVQGQFTAKEKTYDYNGANVSILQVENLSDTAYTVTITGKFKDSNGNVLKTESKTFEGFPGGWSNYFVFQPGVKYSSASWDMKADVFNGNTVAQYFEFGGTVNCVTRWVGVNDKGEETITADPEINKNLKRVVGVLAQFGPLFNTRSLPINVVCQTVLFDNNGILYHIGSIDFGNFINDTEYDKYKQVTCYISDILWSEKGKFVMPDNLKNVTGILAIRSVTE